jgi:hypothetical protein
MGLRAICLGSLRAGAARRKSRWKNPEAFKHGAGEACFWWTFCWAAVKMLTPLFKVSRRRRPARYTVAVEV